MNGDLYLVNYLDQGREHQTLAHIKLSKSFGRGSAKALVASELSI